MKITASLFEAFLKCPTKCWLRASNEQPSGNEYAEWVKAQNESYRIAETERLRAQAPPDDFALSPPVENLKTAKWRLAIDVVARTQEMPGSSRREEAQSSVSQPSTPNSQPADQSLVTSAATDQAGASPGQSTDGISVQSSGVVGTDSTPSPESQGRGWNASPPAILESHLHAVERVPSEGRGKAAQFIPIRFIFFNKLTKDDKLLLALDAFVLSAALGREITTGKIIHGDVRFCARASVAIAHEPAAGQSTGTTSEITTAALFRVQPQVHKVKTSALAGEVRKRLEKIAALLANPTPPDLVLNRHCAECEFQARCRKIAIEKDDLSLLAGMSAKERQKLRSKGIFTVTQLSYTFRPRRRPKRLRDKREKYHHALKALAIREKKIHIVGSPELKIEGTHVYLDVEGLPDRDFYYLIGLRIGSGDSAVQHSLWADTVEEEAKIWREFLAILETVEKPVLVHYGSYETDFLKEMAKRYGAPVQAAAEQPENQKAINLLSVLLEQVYFPTHSNGVKEIGVWLGFVWSEASPIGVNSVACRHEWERTQAPSLKARLTAYNAEDCQAAEIVMQALVRVCIPASCNESAEKSDEAIYVKSLKRPQRRWGNFVSPFKEFEEINVTAWWDYQRDRIYVKSKGAPQRKISRAASRRKGWLNPVCVNKVIDSPMLMSCPACGGPCVERTRTARTLHDLAFGKSSVKRQVVKYQFRHYWCSRCLKKFGMPREFWQETHFGRNLVAYVLYQTFELNIPFVTVQKTLSRFFALSMPVQTLICMRKAAAKEYETTHDGILKRLVKGSLLHVDETEVSIRGKPAYVWVFTNLHDVAYLYAGGREGAFLHEMLKDFKGVLVSDFYGAYDSLNCAQQKCLVHLIRDLNDEVLSHPYDEELKTIVSDFASLLKPIVGTIDRMGLKRRFLGKYQSVVKRFYRKLAKLNCGSEAASKCKQRFEKNRDKLFTFLSHDGIPWNNNNAEHAVKVFAQLRDVVRGSFTEASVRGYLVLLSICQTCKCNGLDFFDFLRSGEKDIHTFTESRRGRRHQSRTSEPKALPADAVAGEILVAAEITKL